MKNIFYFPKIQRDRWLEREAMRIGERGSEDRRKIRRSNGCSIQHQIQIWFRSEI
ncbi:hypothetical protein HanRHA438_Chr04g0156891 [Helianthus annuus]|nr:hypothetical protein HanIR_Chr04g0158061 [Helianthus annuus]KAJ0925198.1 hypothetical protein HanRHA438_Chr04g0156891 [Helianthus annuus]